MRKVIACILVFFSPFVMAADYDIDVEGAHAFIDFRIQHLGFSWMSGRFNTFSGSFSYDENKPSASKVEVTIDTASIDTNHAERDKHLRGYQFLDVKKYPTAHFISTSYQEHEDGTATLWGDFTFHGVTKPLKIAVEPVGHGKDPWFGYRRGFVGKTQFKMSEFAMDVDQLGPASQTVYLTLSVEGIRR